MASTYPGGINVFTVKRNLLDDVDAAHINEIQAEITAVQRSLGVMPHLDTTLNKRVNSYGTVRSRFEATQRGHHVPIIQLDSTKEGVPNTTTMDINFDAPNVVFDPFAMFNGIGFTIKRGGYWVISTDIVWPADSQGVRGHWIMDNGIERAGTTVPATTSSWATRTCVVWQGALASGRKITTRVRHTAGNSLTLRVTLSAHFVRELNGVQV